MNKTRGHIKPVLGALALLLAFLFAAVYLGGAARPDNLGKAGGEQLALIAKGGLLYDKWYAELDLAKPKTTHPSYPETSKVKGASTWRCKECHGWDGRGKEGAYAKGKHYTGIVGIRRLAGGSRQEVVRILKNDAHRYGGLIPESGLEALAAFVVSGQVDMTRYIDAEKRARGDLFKGGRLYATVCARCHGAEGREINFGSKKKPKYLGQVARSNPWETLHKIRMGQPDENMPSILALSVQDQVDVLAYTLTLPRK